MTKTEIDLLLLDYLNGVISEEQEKELREWIKESPENASYFAKTTAYWELSTSSKTNKKFNTNKGWKKMGYRINPTARYRKIFSEYGKIAAIFVLAFTLGFYFYQYKSLSIQNLSADSQIVNEVPLGSRSMVTLPDGSKVWLNAGSKLAYAIDFNKDNRYLQLEGEAFFNVITNKAKPFFVEANGLKVKATGTQFNVSAYLDDDFIETTLVEGKISVNRLKAHKNDEVVLVPHQKLTIYKQSNDCKKKLNIKNVELISNVDTRIHTSWKDEEWIIKKEKLGTLAQKLERRYNAKIHFEDNTLRDYSYSGTLTDETLWQVLNIISQTSPIAFELDKKHVTISSK